MAEKQIAADKTPEDKLDDAHKVKRLLNEAIWREAKGILTGP